MDKALREKIDHSRFFQASVLEVAALLPPTDEELHALIAETVAAGDQLGFIMVTTAALDRGRRVSAEHLVGGAALAGSPDRLGNFAWKMDGDVPGALMAAQTSTVLAPEIHAAALFIVAAWCAERRDGKLPPEFAGEARHLARHKNLSKHALLYLAAAAMKAKDDGFLAVLRQRFPVLVRAELEPHTENAAQAHIALYAIPALQMVPAEAPKTLAHGRPMRRAIEKLGRNALCRCGSGRKYKHCCFENDQERLHFSSEVAGRTRAELRAEPEAGLTESRIKALQPFELAQIDPAKVPENLRRAYVTQLTGLLVLDRVAGYFEVVDWNDERREEWDFAIFFVMRRQEKAIAQRMLAARTRHEPVEDLRDGVQLLLARDDPAAEIAVLAETARHILDETDPNELERLAYGILCSRHAELGILVCRSLIPLLPRREATFLLNQILETRDRLNLPPDDPFSDVLERRLGEETSDEGSDAAALRTARKRLDTKAAEVRELTEKIERQRRELGHLEEKQNTGAQPTAHAATDDTALREMRIELARLKTILGERSAERTTLRRELEKARDELDTLRHANPAASPAVKDTDEGEDAHYLPEQPAGNQPVRLIEFPHKFRETLDELPRQAARAALAMIGRLAGGEPAAFAGVVQLKAIHGVLRQRIGSEHRLLFRLLPDRVQVLDLINRRDLDRKIKTLRSAG